LNANIYPKKKEKYNLVSKIPCFAAQCLLWRSLFQDSTTKADFESG